MKITDVSVAVEEIPNPDHFRWRAGLPGSDPNQITTRIEILTDDGVTGSCYMVRGAGRLIPDLFDRRIRPMLLGKDPLLREQLWHEIWELDRIEEFPIYAFGLVDIALWDLVAKIAGLPLYKVIGGFRDRIPAYASTVTFDSTEEFLHVADQCLDLGFTAIKLHAWGDPKRDAKLGQDLRAHVGPEIELMYDGSAGFDLVDALYVGHALQEAGFFWYEEPMREFNINAYRILADDLRIPILSGETSDGAHFNIADFIVQGAADMVRTSTHFKGGITGGLRIAHLAESFNMRAEVHGGGLPNLHLACAIPNTTWYESLIKTSDVVREDGIGPDGCISPPDIAGIGWDA